MKLQLIAEGSTQRDRKTLRWGLSFLIGDVLFDTFGRKDIFRKNLRKSRINLSRIRHIVLSHEDWDHIAGLEYILKARPGIPVHICAKTGKALKKMIGDRKGLTIEVTKARRITRNIFTLGPMRADTDRGVLYEQALVAKSHNGFSVITGCAHPGIVRIVKHAVKVFGKRIYTVCGGFHMKDNPPEKNQKIVTALRDLGVRKVLPLHCTGANARRLFDKSYGPGCAHLKEGGKWSL